MKNCVIGQTIEKRKIESKDYSERQLSQAFVLTRKFRDRHFGFVE